MKLIILLVSIFNVLHASEKDWFEDDVQILCKDMEYDKHCKSGKDGWFSKSFVDKNTKENFGSYDHSQFGPFYRFNCGDSFDIKGKSLKCEQFVLEIRNKNKECNNCLQIEFDGGG